MRRPAIIALLSAVIVTALVAMPVGRLWTPSPLDRDDAAIVADALPRLAFLREQLDNGAAERMQQLFPEGYLFSHLLYGIAWVDVAERLPADDQDRATAVRESRRALAATRTPAGTAPFSPDADPPYGVFYTGWTTWLGAGALRVAGGRAADPAAADALRTTTDQLAAALDRTLAGNRPFLPAYPGAAWPVDTVVAVAAVRAADDVLGSDHQAVVDRWVAAARQRTDPTTGLLPHQVDPDTMAPLEGVRATSQVVLLRFLADVDPEWARASWTTARRIFASDVVGAPALREHPRGVTGTGDVDSGPLVLGLSASASAVAIGTATVLGDRTAARALTGLAEITGVPVDIGGTRRYAGGALPVGDAFLVWSMTARLWTAEPASSTSTSTSTSTAWAAAPAWWRLPWLMAALMIVGPPWTVAIASIVAGRRGRPGRRRAAEISAADPT